MKASLAFICGLLCLCLCLQAQEGKGVKIPGWERSSLEPRDNPQRTWKNVSPGFMNVPTDVKVDGETISALVDIGGLIQSTDGGRTWRHLTFNSYDGISYPEFWRFDINPANKRNIVIGGRLLSRSVDGGATWDSSGRGLPAPRHGAIGNCWGALRFNCDGSLLVAAYGDDVLTPRGNDKHLAKRFDKKLLFLSSDGGESFRSVMIDSPFAAVKQLLMAPANPNEFLVSFADGSLFLCRDALAGKPELRPIALPEGFFARDICAVPGEKDSFVLILNPIKEKGPAKLLSMKLDASGKPEFSELSVKDADGRPFPGRRFCSGAFNPGKPGQFALCSLERDILVSDDGLKSFRRVTLPKELAAEEVVGHYYGSSLQRVSFGRSPHVVLESRIGLWTCDSDFKNFRALTMTRDGDLFGNNGVGMPANINSLVITKGHAAFCAQDHGAWISDGEDCAKWRMLTGKSNWSKFPEQPSTWGAPYTWTHQVQRLFASYDEKFLYISCNAMIKKKYKHDFWAEKKIFLTSDLGREWTDITPRLGRGDVYPEGTQFLKVLFDEKDSSRQWFLFGDALYYTGDGAESFKRLDSPLFAKITEKDRFRFSDIAYDSARDVLYLGVDPDRFMTSVPADFHALLVSRDKGATWIPMDIGQPAVRSLCVLDSGALVVGTQVVGSTPARLIVVPCGAKYEPSMVKLSVGDADRELEANQNSVWPVISDGEDVLAYSNIEWFHSDKFFAQGPLLSRDGGKTFKWILQDLPNTFIWSATMKDGKILLGTTSGLMEWKYK